ncbi:hypothetical protein LCGC14_0700940 [marine sediment metagenome]|uniref:Cobalamin ABC transporter n=1 Tax=marine sediment metagenome TaxID=412755 RepID=A0A0F9T3P8_9ZZZZ|nr:hypothetical protein [Methylophaga sp.]HEC58295.1 hypothetical protein [Methylophaga sp.]
MPTLSKRYQFIIGFILIAIMAITRGHHFATLSHLPSATLALFFLAGLYLSGKWMFVVLLAEAALLDYLSMTFAGGSTFCASPAYALLLPAYGMLYLAGQWYKQRYQYTWSTLLPLTASLIVATAISKVFSSGGFYLFSGRYTDQTWVEFGERFIKYYPSSLSSLAFYIAIAMICHVLVVSLANTSTKQSGQHS